MMGGGRPDFASMTTEEREKMRKQFQDREDERKKARFEATRKKALNHPVVVEALQVFEASGRPVEVRVDEG